MERAHGRNRGGTIAALDVGTGKVCCFIARIQEDGLRVVGVGHHGSSGLRRGAIIDMEAVEQSIDAAVAGAEEMSGEHIREVFVNVSGGHPVSSTVNASIPVSGREISQSDVRRVLAEGRLPPGGGVRDLLHANPVGYEVDGSRGIRDPRGMYGERLGVDIHMVSAAADAVRNLGTCLSACRLSVRAWVASPWASALACLVPDETELGVTLVDMGAGNTTMAGFVGGELVATAFIPVGGNHVTNDLAVGLGTPVGDAERLKALYGSAIAPPGEEDHIVDVPVIGEDPGSPPNRVPRSLLAGIIQPRLEETMEMVRERLESQSFQGPPSGRVVFTGGASQLEGLRGFASLMLDRQVRPGRPLRFTGLAESVCGPAFSTAAGLLKYAVERHVDNPAASAAGQRPAGAGLLRRAGGWLRANF